MKKIINIIFLMIICFLPIMVDAKATFEYKNQFINKKFFFKENKEYFFFDDSYDYDEVGYLKIYDVNGNKIREDKLIDEFGSSSNPFIESKYFNQYFKYINKRYNVAYDSTNKIVYDVNYNDKLFYYYDEGNNIEILFDDDIEFTKKLLGKKYDIALAFLSEDFYIVNISETDGYYIVYYEDSNYDNNIIILDSELDVVETFDNSNYNVSVQVYNDFIFYMEDNINLKIFDLNGKQVGELKIENENINHDEQDGFCSEFFPFLIDVVDDELFIHFDEFHCEQRVNYNDETLYDSVGVTLYVDELTLRYKINFEIDKVESNNGEFTYVEKVDEDGKSYVELKITPKEGYIVDKIIVTDTNGNKIEVKDNKFYKPLNDVKIEVQYRVTGEYVPIPDTFLGKSLTLIIIGFILIGLGTYTINYVKN